MTNHESDELLRQVIDQLGEIRDVLAERLPKPVEVKMEPPLTSGARQIVVTGESELGEAQPSPVTAKKPPAKKAAAKPH